MQNDVSTLDIEITANTVHVDANIFYKKKHLQIFSLWAVSSRNFQGLSFTSQDVGTVFAFSGMC